MKGTGRVRQAAGFGGGVLIAVGIVASAAFRPDGIPVTMVAFFALGIFTFGYLLWRLATGRDGLWRRGPTRRRLSRLDQRASAEKDHQR